jgi:hypothetical protein
MSTTDLLLKRLEQELRPIARQRIANGQLPREELTGVWGICPIGPQLCSLCDKPIQPDEVDYEIERVGAAPHTLRFHRVCHYAWQLECARAKRSPRRSIPRNPH